VDADAEYRRLGFLRGRNAQVLLFLQGGPGDVTTPWACSIFAPWEARLEGRSAT
jgi:hypothetical protein